MTENLGKNEFFVAEASKSAVIDKNSCGKKMVSKF